MSAPSESEIQAQWRNAIALIKKLWAAGRTDTPNIISLLNTLVESVESDFAPNIISGGQGIRNSLANIIRQAAGLQLPHIQSYVKHIFSYYNLTDVNAMLDFLYDRFANSTQRIASRQFVFQSPVAGGGNNGNGVILRLNKDGYNFDIENQHADTKQAKCVEDVSTGTAKWEEIFEFRGQDAGIDGLDEIGSGMSKRIAAISARDSLLLNPSFSSFAGEIDAPTDITDWTSNITVNGTNYEFSESEYYRDFAGDTTPRSLLMKAASIISQKLSTRGTVLDWRRPYLLQVAWKRGDVGHAGSLAIKMGSQTVLVDVGADANWHILRIVIDTNCWPKNFTEADTEISIQWIPAAGNVFVDDVLFIPFEEFDGSFYAIVPDNTAPVQFLKLDLFDWTDSETGAVIQYWLFRAFNKYLPHATGGGINFSDPT